jgi:uncharacterized protein (TIGR02246 family)
MCWPITIEAAMKSYVLVITILVIGLVLPAQAQDASKAAEDLSQKWVAAYDAGDAAAVAKLFTPDGVFVPATGAVLKGREAIENAIAERIKAGWNKETINVIGGSAVGSGVWAIADYALIGSGENEGGKSGQVLVHDSDGWHFVLVIANLTPAKQ